MCLPSSHSTGYGYQKELPAGMKWDEFRDLLVGLGPDTALGRIISIRSEEDKEVLKHFTKEQKRIRNEWKTRRAKQIKPEDMKEILKDSESIYIYGEEVKWREA